MIGLILYFVVFKSKNILFFYFFLKKKLHTLFSIEKETLVFIIKLFEIVEETIFFVVKDNDDNDDDDDKVDDGNVGGGVGVHLATASQLQGDWQSEKQF